MSEARELDLALLIADLCGYTALTETHGALTASVVSRLMWKMGNGVLPAPERDRG